MWEPMLSNYFICKYHIDEFCRIYNPSAPAPAPYAPTTGPTMASATPAAPPAQPRSPSGGRVNNTNFNQNLFGVYRDRNLRTMDVRQRIRSGNIPQLPASKVDQDSLCLAWHTKGQCNSNCLRIRDHV